jgi:dTDP-4-dehydrorhamnose 3,5-epimerase
MEVIPTRLQGLAILQPRVFEDERGFFLETYSRARYAAAGVDVEFVQDNHSRSVRGAIRGLHMQLPPGQAKLVRCARGSAFDVAVDLRKGSPTFGQWEAVELDDVLHRQLYIPVGFAHGAMALTDGMDLAYKVSSYYDPATEIGVAWDDPDLAIPWPLPDAVVSERDRANPRLAEIVDRLPEW